MSCVFQPWCYIMCCVKTIRKWAIKWKFLFRRRSFASLLRLFEVNLVFETKFPVVKVSIYNNNSINLYCNTKNSYISKNQQIFSILCFQDNTAGKASSGYWVMKNYKMIAQFLQLSIQFQQNTLEIKDMMFAQQQKQI